MRWELTRSQKTSQRGTEGTNGQTGAGVAAGAPTPSSVQGNAGLLAQPQPFCCATCTERGREWNEIGAVGVVWGSQWMGASLLWARKTGFRRKRASSSFLGLQAWLCTRKGSCSNHKGFGGSRGQVRGTCAPRTVCRLPRTPAWRSTSAGKCPGRKETPQWVPRLPPSTPLPLLGTLGPNPAQELLPFLLFGVPVRTNPDVDHAGSLSANPLVEGLSLCFNAPLP